MPRGSTQAGQGTVSTMRYDSKQMKGVKCPDKMKRSNSSSITAPIAYAEMDSSVKNSVPKSHRPHFPGAHGVLVAGCPMDSMDRAHFYQATTLSQAKVPRVHLDIHTGQLCPAMSGAVTLCMGCDIRVAEGLLRSGE